MNSIDPGSLLVGGSPLPFVALGSPWVLLLTATAGVALVLYGWQQGEARPSFADRGRGGAGSADDLVECPNCTALESPTRTVCRFWGEPLAGPGLE